jgi:aspartate racemase
MALTIGILGGMGPAATLDLMDKILKAGARAREQDNVRLIVDCNPGVLDRNAALAGNGPSPGPGLAAMARGLAAAGADFLVMACNAAHVWQGDIEGATPLPFVSIVDEACGWLAANGPSGRRVGLMAAGATLDSGLYQNALGAVGLRALRPMPAVSAKFMEALYAFKAGDLGPEPRAAMRWCARALIEDGAQVILAACTEVPLLLTSADIPISLVDATQILARRAVDYAHGEPFPVRAAMSGAQTSPVAAVSA